MQIRGATPDDAEAILAIYAPVVRDTTISFELEPPTAEEMRGRIVSTTVHLPWLVGVDDEARAVVGYVYTGKHRERADRKASMTGNIVSSTGFCPIGRRCTQAVQGSGRYRTNELSPSSAATSQSAR